MMNKSRVIDLENAVRWIEVIKKKLIFPDNVWLKFRMEHLEMHRTRNQCEAFILRRNIR